jgi:hypothetical protein
MSELFELIVNDVRAISKVTPCEFIDNDTLVYKYSLLLSINEREERITINVMCDDSMIRIVCVRVDGVCLEVFTLAGHATSVIGYSDYSIDELAKAICVCVCGISYENALNTIGAANIVGNIRRAFNF